MSAMNPYFETDAELLDDIRERLLAMVGLPRQVGPITRKRLAELCQVVGLRISRADDAFWLILRPGQDRRPAHRPEPPAQPEAVRFERYAVARLNRLGFDCRECGDHLTGDEPGARWTAGPWDGVKSVYGAIVTDRFLHDRWHGSSTHRDARLRETVLALFDDA